jgi:alpha-glucosidase
VPYSAEEVNQRAPSWRYDGETLTTIILLPKASTAQGVEVRVRAPQADAALISGARGKLSRLKRAVTTMNQAWPKGTSPDALLDAAQAGSRMTYKPESARNELEKLNREMPEVVKQIQGVEADPKLIEKAVALLGEK